MRTMLTSVILSSLDLVKILGLRKREVKFEKKCWNIKKCIQQEIVKICLTNVSEIVNESYNSKNKTESWLRFKNISNSIIIKDSTNQLKASSMLWHLRTIRRFPRFGLNVCRIMKLKKRTEWNAVGVSKVVT